MLSTARGAQYSRAPPRNARRAPQLLSELRVAAARAEPGVAAAQLRYDTLERNSFHMCGRYELNSTPKELRGHFHDLLPEASWSAMTLEGGYNIAPSRRCPVIRYGKREGHNVLEHLTWGYRPQWAKRGWINARDDRLFETPAFKDAARKRRALVVATGWYEWRAMDEKRKQPYYIHLDAPFAFAGIWTARKSNQEDWELSFAIVTTGSAGVVHHIHERMPLIMAPRHYAAWLNPETRRPEALLAPFAAERMTAHPVSTRVNDPRNDDPELIEPLPDAAPDSAVEPTNGA
jgi:putative SOS response-associated peptidase YedK